MTQNNKPELQTRLDEPTPNGGAYSIAYWQDVDGTPVDKSVAVRCEIIEYDAQGADIFRTHGVCGVIDEQRDGLLS